MKKRNLKLLSLNKKSISNFKNVKGGFFTRQEDEFPSLVSCFTMNEDCLPPLPPPSDTGAPSMILCPTLVAC